MQREMWMDRRMDRRMGSDKDGARRQVGPEGCGHGRKKENPGTDFEAKPVPGFCFPGPKHESFVLFFGRGAAGGFGGYFTRSKSMVSNSSQTLPS